IGGMRHFLFDLVSCMADMAPNHEFVIFQPVWADDLEITRCNVKIRQCRGVPLVRLSRVVYEQSVYNLLINRSGVDVFLGCNNTLPLGLRIPSVAVVQSLQYFDFPKTYNWDNLIYLRSMVPRALRSAKRVIALSEASKQTIIQKIAIDPNCIDVI